MVAAYLIAIASATMGQTSSVSYAGYTFSTDLSYPGRLAPAPAAGVYVTDQPTDRVLQYDSAGAVEQARHEGALLFALRFGSGEFGLQLRDPSGDRRVEFSLREGTSGRQGCGRRCRCGRRNRCRCRNRCSARGGRRGGRR